MTARDVSCIPSMCLKKKCVPKCLLKYGVTLKTTVVRLKRMSDYALTFIICFMAGVKLLHGHALRLPAS